MSRYGGASRSSQPGSKIYVGNLPGEVRERDIEDIFYKFGKIVDVDLKNSRGRGVGPPFAFVEFEDYRDAQDAIKGRDGYPMSGYKLKVEFPRGGSGGFRGSFRGSRGSGGGGSSRRGRRPECCVTVSGLPPTGSWQDLKDHMREAGDVLFTDVNKDGTGHVEFAHEDYARYAVKNLNDSKFRSHEGEIAYIHVRENYDHGSSSYSPRSRSRPSPNYSPRKYSYSRSRSRSRSPF